MKLDADGPQSLRPEVMNVLVMLFEAKSLATVAKKLDCAEEIICAVVTSAERQCNCTFFMLEDDTVTPTTICTEVIPALQEITRQFDAFVDMISEAVSKTGKPQSWVKSMNKQMQMPILRDSVGAARLAADHIEMHMDDCPTQATVAAVAKILLDRGLLSGALITDCYMEARGPSINAEMLIKESGMMTVLKAGLDSHKEMFTRQQVKGLWNREIREEFLAELVTRLREQKA